MRALLIALILTFAALTGLGQNNPLFSHYALNPIYAHPAIGSFESVSFTSTMVRAQWAGYNSSFDGPGGAPNTQFVNALIISKSFINSFGVNVINDNLGPTNNLEATLPISKSFNIGFSKISLGVAPGVVSRTLDFSKLRFNDPGDPLYIESRETGVGFNLAAGLAFETRNNVMAAFSVSNILEPGFNYDFDESEFSNDLKRTYTGFFKITRSISRDLLISPNLQLSSDLNTFTFDVGAFLNYRQRAWAGTAYRWEEAITLNFGYSFLKDNSLKAGYAFDIVINEQDAKQFSSQEFFIRYDLPNIVFGGKKQIKTPRFTY